MLYNYVQTKTLEPIENLINVLDFYEFEDEYYRARTILFAKAIHNLKKYDFQQFREYWNWLNFNDCILWNYLWSVLGFKSEVLDKGFPSSVAHLSFVKLGIFKYMDVKSVQECMPYVSPWNKPLGQESYYEGLGQHLSDGGDKVSFYCERIISYVRDLINWLKITEDQFCYVARNPDSSFALKIIQKLHLPMEDE